MRNKEEGKWWKTDIFLAKWWKKLHKIPWMYKNKYIQLTNSARLSCFDSKPKKMVWSVAITTMRLSYWWHGCCVTCQWEIGAPPSCRALKHRWWQNGKMTKSSIQGQNLTADEWGRTACCLSLPPWELSRGQLDVWHDVTPICCTKIERLADVFFHG